MQLLEEETEEQAEEEQTRARSRKCGFVLEADWPSGLPVWDRRCRGRFRRGTGDRGRCRRRGTGEEQEEVQTEEQAEEEQAETEQEEPAEEEQEEVQTAEQAEEEQTEAKQTNRGSAGTPPGTPPERRSRIPVGGPEHRWRPPQGTPAEVDSLTG